MTTQKHTPGPWTTRDDVDKCTVFRVTGDNWGSMVIVHGNTDRARHEEGRANLKLILAAPDLLEESKKLLKALGDCTITKDLQRVVRAAEVHCCPCECTCGCHKAKCL